MLTSRDSELLRLRERLNLPDDLRFFLLENHDLNFYYYGLVDQIGNWDEKRFSRSLAALECLSDLDPTQCDTTLDELIACRCLARRSSPLRREYWLDWLKNLRSPRHLAERLRRTTPDAIPGMVHDLATLFHVIPQSCQVGVMRPVSERLFIQRGGFLQLDERAPWTSIDSTLALLRPLEYFFGIGTPGARRANVHVLHGELGFLLGTILDFSCSNLSAEARQEIERTLEGLAILELASALRTSRAGNSMFHRLAANLHRALPLHSALHWVNCRASANLRCAFGLSWEQRSTDPRSVMDSAERLEDLPEAALSWFQAEVLRVSRGSDSMIIQTAYGPGLCSNLPHWKFAGASTHPLDPRLCVTIVSSDHQEALQLLLPRLAQAEYASPSVIRSVAAFLDAARLASLEVTSRGRYPGGQLALPSSWIYHPESGTAVLNAVDQLRRAWAGDPIEKPLPLLLLCGCPGTGKTTTADWIAREVVGDPDPLRIDAGDIKGGYYGDTESNLSKVITSLCVEGPRVVIIDEIEQFARKLSHEASHDNVTAALKVGLDRVVRHVRENPRARVVLICTTNNFAELDAAIKSRFHAIQLKWGRNEFDRLFELSTWATWTNDAREKLLDIAQRFEYDPRESLRVIKGAERQARLDSISPFPGQEIVVHKAHLEAVIGAQPEWKEEESAAREEGAVSRRDLQNFLDLLTEILDWARSEQVADDKETYDRYLNKNILPWLKQQFPSWTSAYEAIKRFNRARAGAVRER